VTALPSVPVLSSRSPNPVFYVDLRTSNMPSSGPTPARPHQGRDRLYGAVVVGIVALGIVSLFHSLNLVTFVILLGLIVLIFAIG
jgi:hypothetical protein